tara:strand:+ start:136 stop:723 length:588 start_codon:yes stop_codon:yes gene_type:complete
MKTIDTICQVIEENFTSLTNLEYEILKEHSYIKEYKKNEIIFNEHSSPKTIFFVLDGSARLFYNVHGKDRTAYFYTKGNFIFTGRSLRHEVLTNENLQALEQTTLLCISKPMSEKLFQYCPKFEHIARIGAEDELIARRKLIASLISLDAKERYLDFMKNNKTLFLKIPQKYIASYLGVSPETLSRIRNKVAAAS